jgi:hypothetical protein
MKRRGGKTVLNKKILVPTEAPSFPSERAASAIRQPDNRQRLEPPAAIVPIESAVRSNSRDRSVTVMGVVFSLAFAISGFAAIMHIWVNAGMIR